MTLDSELKKGLKELGFKKTPTTNSLLAALIEKDPEAFLKLRYIPPHIQNDKSGKYKNRSWMVSLGVGQDYIAGETLEDALARAYVLSALKVPPEEKSALEGFVIPD